MGVLAEVSDRLDRVPDLQWYAESILERSPSEYLRERLRVLAVSCANPSDIDVSAERGAKFGDLELRWETTDDADDTSEMSAASRFALMDSAVLLHQTAEALWLWFLASAVEAPAPWFAIPSTTPAKLQAQISAFQDAPVGTRDHAVGMAFIDAVAARAVL
ncbi:MAG: hypothetical protein F2817_04640, partial [Actinobacteria bacterium]|nr:hypothetical protein [Actinomycetota bacterium]